MKQKRTLTERLTAPADIAGLAFFRILFGVGMGLDLLVQFATGKISALWLRSAFHFPYPGLGWLPVLPGPLMLLLHLALIALATCIALGFFYRASAAAFAVSYVYVFFADASAYQNNAWLACLFAALLAVLPAHRAKSLDVARGRVTSAATVPAWTYWLLRFQIAIVFLFAGIARLNSDWFAGIPLKFWLTDAARSSMFGPFFTQPWALPVLIFAIPFYELLLTPLLLIRHTRLIAFIAAVSMKLTAIISLGLVSLTWMPVLALATFFNPSWPRRFNFITTQPAAPAATAHSLKPLPLAVVSLFIAVQLVLPLRHHLIPGDISWTEEGATFAWRSNVRSKACASLFYIRDPVENKTRCIEPADELAPVQVRNLAKRPDLIRQFAKLLADREMKHGQQRPQVRARARAALNGKLPRLLVNPALNLAAVPPAPLMHTAPWIMSPTNAPAGDGSASDVDELRADYRKLKHELLEIKVSAEIGAFTNTPHAGTTGLNLAPATPAQRWRKELEKLLLLEKLQDAILASNPIEKPAPAE